VAAGEAMTINEITNRLQAKHSGAGITADRVRNACFNMNRTGVLVKVGKPNYVQRFEIGRELQKCGTKPHANTDPEVLARRRARRTERERERRQQRGDMSWAEWSAHRQAQKVARMAEKDAERAEKLRQRAERQAATEQRRKEREARKAEKAADAKAKAAQQAKRQQAAAQRKQKVLAALARKAEQATKRESMRLVSPVAGSLNAAAPKKPAMTSDDFLRQGGQIERIPASWEREAA